VTSSSTISAKHRTLKRRRLAALAMLAACAGGAAAVAGCGDPNAVRVALQASPAAGRDVRRLDISGQIVGPPAGLHYKWFSVSGECDPQESTLPATSFRFAEGATRDRVSVEVWRDDRRVAQSEIDVRLDEQRARMMTQPGPDVRIEITQIPPYEPEGGDFTRAEIGGTVNGDVSPDYQVVIYARADAWYIQPNSHAFHAIRQGKTWGSWTHTGSSYAALLVRPGFDAYTRLDVLPQVGEYVLARSVVEGARR